MERAPRQLLAAFARVPLRENSCQLLDRTQHVDHEIARVRGAAFDARFQSGLEPLQERDRVFGQAVAKPIAANVLVAADLQWLGAPLDAAPGEQLVDVASEGLLVPAGVGGTSDAAQGIFDLIGAIGMHLARSTFAGIVEPSA